LDPALLWDGASGIGHGAWESPGGVTNIARNLA
jgi:hypothetical protein